MTPSSSGKCLGCGKNNPSDCRYVDGNWECTRFGEIGATRPGGKCVAVSDDGLRRLWVPDSFYANLSLGAESNGKMPSGSGLKEAVSALLEQHPDGADRDIAISDLAALHKRNIREVREIANAIQSEAFAEEALSADLSAGAELAQLDDSDLDIGVFIPEGLREQLISARDLLECPGQWILFAFLTCVASCLGVGYKVEARRGWQSPVNLFTAIVGSTGEGKSPALQACIDELISLHDERFQDYQKARASYERCLSAWKETKDHRERGDEPAAPFEPAGVFTEATLEAIFSALGSDPTGSLWYREELSGAVSSLDKYREGGDRASLLELWDSRPVIIRRKGSPTIRVPSAAMSILGGVQPEIIDKSFGEHDADGFRARFLWVPGRPRQRTWKVNPDYVDPRPAIRWYYDRARIWPSCVVELTPQSQKVFEKLFGIAEKERTTESRPLGVRAWASKMTGHCLRLAGILHAIEAIFSLREVPLEEFAATVATRTHIEEGTMRKAARLTLRCYGWTRLMYEVNGAQADGNADIAKLLKLLERKGRLSAKEVQNGLRPYKKHSAEQIRRLFANLEKHGYVLTEGQGNSLTMIWKDGGISK
jgi:hypothetical protein